MQTDTSERKKLCPESGRGFPFLSLFLSLPFNTLTSPLPPTSTVTSIIIVSAREEAEAVYLLKALHAE